MTDLVLASGNAGKLHEIQHYFELHKLPLKLRLQSEFAVESAAETASTFVENALLKARHAAGCTGLAALADDSGLVVPALGGAPGIYSARFAGEKATDQENNQKLIKEISRFHDPVPAYFVCLLALTRTPDDPLPVVAQGVWHGVLINTPRGEHGFGYDPLFVPDNAQHTAAELTKAQKSQVSHRALALKSLVRKLVRTPV